MVISVSPGFEGAGVFAAPVIEVLFPGMAKVT
jgi:hypothetical protein